MKNADPAVLADSEHVASLDDVLASLQARLEDSGVEKTADRGYGIADTYALLEKGDASLHDVNVSNLAYMHDALDAAVYAASLIDFRPGVKEARERLEALQGQLDVLKADKKNPHKTLTAWKELYSGYAHAFEVETLKLWPHLAHLANSAQAYDEARLNEKNPGYVAFPEATNVKTVEQDPKNGKIYTIAFPDTGDLVSLSENQINAVQMMLSAENEQRNPLDLDSAAVFDRPASIVMRLGRVEQELAWQKDLKEIEDKLVAWGKQKELKTSGRAIRKGLAPARLNDAAAADLALALRFIETLPPGLQYQCKKFALDAVCNDKAALTTDETLKLALNGATGNADLRNHVAGAIDQPASLSFLLTLGEKVSENTDTFLTKAPLPQLKLEQRRQTFTLPQEKTALLDTWQKSAPVFKAATDIIHAYSPDAKHSKGTQADPLFFDVSKTMQKFANWNLSDAHTQKTFAASRRDLSVAIDKLDRIAGMARETLALIRLQIKNHQKLPDGDQTVLARLKSDEGALSVLPRYTSEMYESAGHFKRAQATGNPVFENAANDQLRKDLVQHIVSYGNKEDEAVKIVDGLFEDIKGQRYALNQLEALRFALAPYSNHASLSFTERFKTRKHIRRARAELRELLKAADTRYYAIPEFVAKNDIEAGSDEEKTVRESYAEHGNLVAMHFRNLQQAFHGYGRIVAKAAAKKAQAENKARPAAAKKAETKPAAPATEEAPVLRGEAPPAFLSERNQAAPAAMRNDRDDDFGASDLLQRLARHARQRAATPADDSRDPETPSLGNMLKRKKSVPARDENARIEPTISIPENTDDVKTTPQLPFGSLDREQKIAAVEDALRAFNISRARGPEDTEAASETHAALHADPDAAPRDVKERAAKAEPAQKTGRGERIGRAAAQGIKAFREARDARRAAAAETETAKPLTEGQRIKKAIVLLGYGAKATGPGALWLGRATVAVVRRTGMPLLIGGVTGWGVRAGLGVGVGYLGAIAAFPLVGVAVGAMAVLAATGLGYYAATGAARFGMLYTQNFESSNKVFASTIAAVRQTWQERKEGKLQKMRWEALKGFGPLLKNSYKAVRERDAANEGRGFKNFLKTSWAGMAARTFIEAAQTDKEGFRLGLAGIMGATGAAVAAGITDLLTAPPAEMASFEEWKQASLQQLDNWRQAASGWAQSAQDKFNDLVSRLGTAEAPNELPTSRASVDEVLRETREAAPEIVNPWTNGIPGITVMRPEDWLRLDPALRPYFANPEFNVLDPLNWQNNQWSSPLETWQRYMALPPFTFNSDQPWTISPQWEAGRTFTWPQPDVVPETEHVVPRVEEGTVVPEAATVSAADAIAAATTNTGKIMAFVQHDASFAKALTYVQELRARGVDVSALERMLGDPANPRPGTIYGGSFTKLNDFLNNISEGGIVGRNGMRTSIRGMGLNRELALEIRSSMARLLPPETFSTRGWRAAARFNQLVIDYINGDKVPASVARRMPLDIRPPQYRM